eukprot:1690789-Pyramimonas_sp.AAC.1
MGSPCALGGQHPPTIQAGIQGKGRRRTKKRRERKTLGDAAPPPPVSEFFVTLTVQKFSPSSRLRLFAHSLPNIFTARPQEPQPPRRGP